MAYYVRVELLNNNPMKLCEMTCSGVWDIQFWKLCFVYKFKQINFGLRWTKYRIKCTTKYWIKYPLL